MKNTSAKEVGKATGTLRSTWCQHSHSSDHRRSRAVFEPPPRGSRKGSILSDQYVSQTLKSSYYLLIWVSQTSLPMPGLANGRHPLPSPPVHNNAEPIVHPHPVILCHQGRHLPTLRSLVNLWRLRTHATPGVATNVLKMTRALTRRLSRRWNSKNGPSGWASGSHITMLHGSRSLI